jgi:hypothetical protein
LLVAFRTPPTRVEAPERPRPYRPLRLVHHISIGGYAAPARALDSLIDLDSVLPPLCVIWIGWGSDRRPSAISLRRSHVRRNLRHSSKAGHALLGPLFCTGLEKVPDGPRGGASAGRPGLGAGENTVRAIGNCYSASERPGRKRWWWFDDLLPFWTAALTSPVNTPSPARLFPRWARCSHIRRMRSWPSGSTVA